MIAAAVALLAVTGGIVAFGIATFGGSTPAPAVATAEVVPELVPGTASAVAAPTEVGELRIESVPDGARVMLDGREAGFTPLTLKNVPAGRHALILEGDSGTVRRTVRVQSGERTVARYEITAGFLSVFSRIPLEIYDGTRKLGTSDEGHILLAPGQYKVKLVNAHYGYSEEAEFAIKPGEISTHSVTLPEGSLLVSTESGAEIFVEGEFKGTAPLGPIAIPIGAREVHVRHPQLGERRQSIEIFSGRPTELDVILDGRATPRPQPRLAPLSMPPERRTILPN
jgi:hypothetical protein